MKSMQSRKRYRVVLPKHPDGSPRRAGIPAVMWTDGLPGATVVCTRTRGVREATVGQASCMEFSFALEWGGEEHIFTVYGTTADEIEQRLSEQFVAIDEES